MSDPKETPAEQEPSEGDSNADRFEWSEGDIEIEEPDEDDDE